MKGWTYRERLAFVWLALTVAPPRAVLIPRRSLRFLRACVAAENRMRELGRAMTSDEYDRFITAEMRTS